MNTTKIFGVIVIILIVIGIMTVGSIVHEMIHYYDLKNKNATIIDVCFVRLPFDEGNNVSFLNRAGGHVIFGYNEDFGFEDYDKLMAHWKVYAIEIIVMIILSIIAFIYFCRRYEEDETLSK